MSTEMTLISPNRVKKHSCSRRELLKCLGAVSPGLSKSQGQRSAYVFENGVVRTFNRDICCSHRCGLRIEGAVRAKHLLPILRKMGDATLEFEESASELAIKNEWSTARIPLEKEIYDVPFDEVESPCRWKSLPAEFSEAIQSVYQCAGKKPQDPPMECVHIHPDYVEVCDRFQIARYLQKTGVEDSVLVLADSIHNLCKFGMTKVSVTGSWIHFKNREGLVHSYRRCQGKYPNLSKFFIKGTPFPIPLKDLSELVRRAEGLRLMAPRSAGEFRICISKNILRLIYKGGEGERIQNETEMEIDYMSDKDIEFMMLPESLKKWMTLEGLCYITDDYLVVDAGKLQYIACIHLLT